MNHAHGSWGTYRSRGGWYTFLGRILIASLFVIVGWSKIADFAGAEQMIATAGFPYPAFFTALAILVEFGGGLMLLFGFHARLSAWLLIIFTAVATLAYHNPAEGQVQMLMFLKNLSIIGGLLYVAAHGAGRWSLSHWNDRMYHGNEYCPDCASDDSYDEDSDGTPAARESNGVKRAEEKVTVLEELEEGGYLPSTIVLPTR